MVLFTFDIKIILQSFNQNLPPTGKVTDEFPF